MSTTCKYCNEPEHKQYKPGLICESCICFVHLSCLRRPGTPGDFTCDVFFDFTCEDCAPDKKEIFTRNKFPWVNVILLTLHHLSTQSYGISNHGFFHYKTHICSFIDRNWQCLFDSNFKQKKNWIGTIAGALSVYNNLFFRSGSVALGETGWWKLQHLFSPAVAAHIIQEMARDRPKGRPRNQMSLDKTLFISKIMEMGYKEYIVNETEVVPVKEAEAVPSKRRRVDAVEPSLPGACLEQDDSRLEDEGTFDDPLNIMLLREGSYSDVETVFRGFSLTPASQLPPSDSSSVHSLQQSLLFYDSDTHSRSPIFNQQEPESDEEMPSSDTKQPDVKVKKTVHVKKSSTRRETLFSSQLNSVDLPWVEKSAEPQNDLVEMTQYEEMQLLKQVENMIPKVKDPNKKSYLCRLRAKLALRRLKRHKHLPVFDLDKAVKLYGGYAGEEARPAAAADRVLDRFQATHVLERLCGTVAGAGAGPLLLARAPPAPARSLYSGVLLKPYIRRDASCDALWLRLTDELLAKANRNNPGYVPAAHGTLDYSYVLPHHIAAVNALCAQFFWPGIDLSEALQYPEFSCVVTYRRLVVACAFLVPDAGHHEAYISFVLTRPEWRRAGIASFMLYHLLQTCTGKDVTLHVSPTNPAIFLYQKFGFKVEELIQDFYEKYYDIDYKGCRHALYLRLVR